VLTYRQSMAFNADARAMRRAGTVSVGAAGKRYRGGRAFVAIAVDDQGVVRDAVSLSGWTTFARPRKLAPVVGKRASSVKGDRVFPGLSQQQREAARQAATLLLQATRPATQEVRS
jgi:glucitol operon activator protein